VVGKLALEATSTEVPAVVRRDGSETGAPGVRAANPKAAQRARAEYPSVMLLQGNCTGKAARLLQAAGLLPIVTNLVAALRAKEAAA